MPTFLYQCPTTGLRVQGWVADDPIEDEAERFQSSLSMRGVGVIPAVDVQIAPADVVEQEKYDVRFLLGPSGEREIKVLSITALKTFPLRGL